MSDDWEEQTDRQLLVSNAADVLVDHAPDRRDEAVEEVWDLVAYFDNRPEAASDPKFSEINAELKRTARDADRLAQTLRRAERQTVVALSRELDRRARSRGASTGGWPRYRMLRDSAWTLARVAEDALTHRRQWGGKGGRPPKLETRDLITACYHLFDAYRPDSPTASVDGAFHAFCLHVYEALTGERDKSLERPVKDVVKQQRDLLG